jgi:chlorobactene glucosyltransferase
VACARRQARRASLFEATLSLIFVLANLIFALRELDIILGSRTSIATCEPDALLPSLSIVVPARNEERQIERCVRSLLATRHPDFEVIVVDDQSSDATRAILDRIGADDARLRILAGEPLPEGWIGKSWALSQGARVTRGAWLLFTDADTVHRPLAASSAQRYAIDRGYDVLSLLTDQETAGLAERLLLPTILFVILLGIGPLDAINDPRKRDTAIFNGQYILTSREAYAAVGGHAAVRAEIAEDLELARRFKHDGRFRTCLAGSNALVRTRMYRSFGELWRGFVKNFGIAARGQTLKAAAGATLIAGVAVSPLVLAALLLTRAWVPAAVLGFSLAAVLSVAEYAMRTMRFRPGSGLAVPLGLALTLAIFATSVVVALSGRRVEWRGRRYATGVFKQSR